MPPLGLPAELIEKIFSHSDRNTAQRTAISHGVLFDIFSKKFSNSNYGKALRFIEKLEGELEAFKEAIKPFKDLAVIWSFYKVMKDLAGFLILVTFAFGYIHQIIPRFKNGTIATLPNIVQHTLDPSVSNQEKESLLEAQANFSNQGMLLQFLVSVSIFVFIPIALCQSNGRYTNSEVNVNHQNLQKLNEILDTHKLIFALDGLDSKQIANGHKIITNKNLYRMLMNELGTIKDFLSLLKTAVQKLRSEGLYSPILLTATSTPAPEVEIGHTRSKPTFVQWCRSSMAFYNSSKSNEDKLLYREQTQAQTRTQTFASSP